MTDQNSSEDQIEISPDHLAELLNEDLSREYQAITDLSRADCGIVRDQVPSSATVPVYCAPFRLTVTV
jgi:hypothetical protein